MLRWTKLGILPSFRTGGGRNRIRAPDLVRFMRERRMEVPEALLLLVTEPERPRIAIIDDDAQLVNVLRQAIERLRPDAQVGSATDGFSGGLLVSEMRPHVLLLDVVMPGVDGVEVCRQIRGRGELDDVSILIVSGNLNRDVEAQLQALGAAACLPKPLSLTTLRDLLDRYLPAAAAPSRR